MVNYEGLNTSMKTEENSEMADDDEKRDIIHVISEFRNSNHWAVALGRDLLWIGGVVGSIALALFLICGTWPAVVTIESQSMVPHMNIGDLVVVVEKDRFGPLQTWVQGNTTGYRKFENYGDVIIYQPNGAKNPVVPIPFLSSGVHPIIHRAMDKADTADLPKYLMLDLANISKYYEPHGGYITKGDNNKNIDQVAVYQGLGVIEPVKDEWIIGKALFTVPLVGYLPLHIVEVTIIIVVLMILHELYLNSLDREDETKKPQKKTRKKQR
jgi:signal peptidase